jgi:Leucine-rich repeat (LRR) protein
LIGELPEEIKVLENTEELYLFGNKLKGTIPDGISSMKQLRNLDVEGNDFSGQPLVKLYNLMNLRAVHLSDNQFDEQISGPGVSNWELVKELWIGNNLFRGVLPEEIGSMESLGTVHKIRYDSNRIC